MSENPYAPPPEGWTPPPREWTPGPPGWPGTPPPHATPSSKGAVLAGVPLLLAAFLTVATGWGVLGAFLEHARHDQYAGIYSPEPDLYPVVAAVMLAAASLLAWGLFAILVRARRPGALALLPYGLVGAVLGMLGIPLVEFLVDRLRA